MDVLYSILKFFHVMSFVFMSIPLFNLIVVNERALLGPSFNYHADRYMENIIKHGAYRCFVFQSAALMTGVLLLIFGPLGIKALWTSWIILVKTFLLFGLLGLLSYVHFFVQPKIEAILARLRPGSPAPEAPINELKPYRAKRKKLATFCLFLVVTTSILGLQVYDTFNPFLNICLITLAGIFALRANKTLIRFGWF